MAKNVELITEESLARMLPPSEAARRLCYSITYVRRLIREGKLPSIDTPLGHLVSPEDVEAWAHGRRQLATPADPGGDGA